MLALPKVRQALLARLAPLQISFWAPGGFLTGPRCGDGEKKTLKYPSGIYWATRLKEAVGGYLAPTPTCQPHTAEVLTVS